MKRNFTLCRQFFSKEISAKKWAAFVILISLGIVAGAAALSFTIDPHYRYRMPVFYKTVYYEIYATAPQILRSMDYDTLMLGTSMTRNFFLDDINNTMNCNAIKLAASGGSMFDLKKFFDIAKESKGKKLKRVILSLDIYSLNKTEPNYKLFDYMYNDHHRKDYRYLFSRQTFSSMVYLIKRKLRPKGKRLHEATKNRMFSTEHAKMRFSLDEVISEARRNEMIHHTQTPYRPESEQTVKNELLPIFDENPDIQFTVYLPPYHIYTYCQSERFGEADALIKQRSKVMKELVRRKNVTLHDFQADRSVVCDGTRFSDIQHFGSRTAKKILNDLVNETRRIRSEADILTNEQELRDLIRENMPAFYRDVQKRK